MNFLVKLTIFLGVSIWSVTAFGTTYWRLRQNAEKYRHDDAIRKYGSIVPDQYFTQKISHFDPQVKGTFKQRYWANNQFWTKSDGPVFLYIGGEGGESAADVQSGHHFEMAQKMGALLVAIEHRFYGQSLNDDGLEMTNLQYLSSQEALADLAVFHALINKKYQLTPHNKWICFGGSYAGSMSAWFRLKYPHLVFAAVASSAPVETIVDFFGYQQIVTKSFSDPIVGGSNECKDIIQSGFAAVDKMLDNAQIQQLAKDFNACAVPSDPYDVQEFLMSLAGQFGFIDQVNSAPEYSGGVTIMTLCKGLISDIDTPYKRLQNIIKSLNRGLCVDVSFRERLNSLKNTTVNRDIGTGVGMRQWTYQTCAEFGYYLTCGDQCMFSKHSSLDPSFKICQEVYGIDKLTLYERIDFTNVYYGSNQPRATRVIFVDGSIDPWHGLSVLTSIGDELSVFINGTSHIADTLPPKASDPPQLLQARKRIEEVVTDWLKTDHAINMD